MNIGQAFKMAWRSICGKKGRSALTILSIFIGIAAVMTIVSTMEGMKAKTMEQYAAMGANRISVSIYSYSYDMDGNPISKDYFSDLYRYCAGLKDYVLGVTPNGQANATVVYGTKSTANMEWKYDDQWNVVSGPPTQYYGSDQYSVCNNLTIAKGRDLAWLDSEKYNQVCVLGAQAARVFFGSANPIGQVLQVNGNKFEVVGVYAARVEPDTPSAYQTDNMIVYPYTATRLLGGQTPTDFLVKAKDDDSMTNAITEIGGYLKSFIDTNSGGYNVYPENHDLAGAGRHCRHFPAGGRYRHYEHHAGDGDGAHERDRHSPKPRRPAQQHCGAVPHRVRYALRHGRTGRHRFRHHWQSGFGKNPVPDDDFSRHMGDAGGFRAVGSAGCAVRQLPGGQGIQIAACGSPAGGLKEREE